MTLRTEVIIITVMIKMRLVGKKRGAGNGNDFGYCFLVIYSLTVLEEDLASNEPVFSGGVDIHKFKGYNSV